ncbi:uncharacterized protein LOC135384602 [Ornithodoros turicata]|uniref:uncharacterized protein LOC135384602 n=1 Tax=Ornithodoros turicata TaxID=34597 RepID=UPI003138B5A5
MTADSCSQSIVVNLNGVETSLTPVINSDGSFVRNGNNYAYKALDGTVLDVLFTGIKQAAHMCTPTVPLQAAAAPPSSEEPGPSYGATESELWTAPKTRFLIGNYKELKELVGKKGGFRTKRALWQMLAERIRATFATDVSPLQVENKWKCLERAYKKAKTKNGSSGHSRVSCDHEDTPTDNEESSGTPPREPETPRQAPLEGNDGGSCKRRRRRDRTPFDALLQAFEKAQRDRAERFDRKMLLLVPLVSAVEKKNEGE